VVRANSMLFAQGEINGVDVARWFQPNQRARRDSANRVRINASKIRAFLRGE
jgi:hypothetical protein